jgi:predicted glutamine amidotransferase
MCRLFGLTAGTVPVQATFWLLDAPDSLRAQSRRNADGSGIGFFDRAGTPVLDKQAEPAYADESFRREARRAWSATFVSHVRWASTGGRTRANTHPFAMRGHLMAHNGGLGELGRLDEQLGGYRDLVAGDTDSERFFALILQQADAHGGDIGAGIGAAARWAAANLPLSSLNAVVAGPRELWALRYPGQHALHVLERPAGPGDRPGAGAGLQVRSITSSMHVPALDTTPSVVVASEALDGESGWRMLAAGELVHVRPDLSVTSTVAVAGPPARLMPLPPGNPNIDS